MNAKNKSVIILRGVSGSGKTSFAKMLQDLHPNVVSVSADQFFVTKNGDYAFDSAKLGSAHAWCFLEFQMAVDRESQLIVVDNTNTCPSEFGRYKEDAEKKGYSVFFIVMENRHGKASVHGVPERTLLKQEERILDSLVLSP
jgi:predicted ABC-type ATPase